jgi:hypothetical protein
MPCGNAPGPSTHRRSEVSASDLIHGPTLACQEKQHSIESRREREESVPADVPPACPVGDQCREVPGGSRGDEPCPSVHFQCERMARDISDCSVLNCGERLLCVAGRRAAEDLPSDAMMCRVDFEDRMLRTSLDHGTAPSSSRITPVLEPFTAGPGAQTCASGNRRNPTVGVGVSVDGPTAGYARISALLSPANDLRHDPSGAYDERWPDRREHNPGRQARGRPGFRMVFIKELYRRSLDPGAAGDDRPRIHASGGESPFDVEPRRFDLSSVGEFGQESSQFLGERGRIFDCQIEAHSPIVTINAEHHVVRIDKAWPDNVRRHAGAEDRTIVAIETGHDRRQHALVVFHGEEHDSRQRVRHLERKHTNRFCTGFAPKKHPKSSGFLCRRIRDKRRRDRRERNSNASGPAGEFRSRMRVST